MLYRPEAGICLYPCRRVCPLLALVELVEHGEETLVGSLPVCDLASVAVKVIENRLAHRAGRGNHNHKRLSAARGRLLHNLVEIAVADSVELVDNDGVRVEAVEGIRVRGQRLELGGRRRKVNVVAALFENGGELGALLHHVYGLCERLFRLVFLGRYGVNLRRALVVCDEHIERESREERTLAVLSPYKKECLSKAPVSRRPLEPPEKELYKCFLEKLEGQRLAERSLRLLAKPLDEDNRPFADGLVEVIRRALVRRVHFRHEATVHGFYPSARDDFAGGNPLPIFPDVVHYLPDRAAGFVIKLISSSPADFFSFSGSNATSWFVRAEKDLIVVL